MNKLVKLSIANIRKTKGNSVSLLVMFAIAALLVNAGLLVFINFGSYFDKITTELNTSNTYYIMSSDVYNEEVEQYIYNHDNVKEVQKEDAIWIFAEAVYNEEPQSDIFLFSDASNERNLSKWKFVGDHLEPDSMSVYLPYRFLESGIYKLNDPFTLTVKDTTLSFTVKGFIEDAYFSSTETGIVGAYLPHETFVKVSETLDDQYNATLIFANLEDINKEVETGIKNITNADNLLASFSNINNGNTMFSFDILIAKMARVMMATMISLMIVAFSAIIVGVCLIVIRFRISNSIEDDMTKIGSLKAIGFTSKQIILSIMIQFLMISFIGSIIGIALSYLTIPVLSDVFAQQSGIKWEQGFDAFISGISLVSILLIVILVAYLASRRIKKLHPIIALSGGLSTHSFRKNHFPLHQTKGSLPVVIALKSIFQNLKQSIMLVIILISVSFAGAFAVIMFYNTVIDNQTFLETPGVELSNVVVTVDPEIDNSIMLEEIEDMNGVNKVQFIDQLVMTINEDEVVAFVMDDFSTKETKTIYEGRYPRHSNEVAISGYLADIYNKEIGDSVNLNVGDHEETYLITGLTQGAFMSGKSIYVRTDGVQLLAPDFNQRSLQIYLNKNAKTEEYVEEIEALYGDTVISVVNMEKDLENGASAYISIVSKVGIVVTIITIAVVVLVLYFVINSSIIRKKREIGIQKSIGFTTLQLMNQYSISFLIPIIIGVLIGCILGITQTNALMSMSQRAMGIMKANYIIKPLWISLFGVGIIIISYMTSLLLTYHVRKISAYDLIIE